MHIRFDWAEKAQGKWIKIMGVTCKMFDVDVV